MQQVKTDAVSKSIAELIRANGSKFFGVTFIKQDGTERTINGRVIRDKDSTGKSTVAHIEKYVVVTLRGRDEKGRRLRRNVNMETIVGLSINGRKLSFK